MEIDSYNNLFETEQNHWWYIARRKILTEIIHHYKLPADARLLEFGSGTGGNLEMLSSFGTLDAIEMSLEAITLTKERFGSRFQIWKGSLPDDLPQINQQYDLICFFDVLEHIKEDTASLSSIHTLLKQNGRVLITVPAYSWLWSVQDKVLHHQRRYNKKTLVNAIPQHLYEIEKISYFNTLLFPLAVIARMKDILLKSQVATGTKPPGIFINNALEKIFSFEKNLVNRCVLPFGLSLYVTLKKINSHA